MFADMENASVKPTKSIGGSQQNMPCEGGGGTYAGAVAHAVRKGAARSAGFKKPEVGLALELTSRGYPGWARKRCPSLIHVDSIDSTTPNCGKACVAPWPPGLPFSRMSNRILSSHCGETLMRCEYEA